MIQGTALRTTFILLGLILFVPSMTQAVPVEAPFGTMPKAILFTGAAKPDSTVSIIIADGAGGTDSRPGMIMSPMGDGSWAVSAMVYPGATYQYYFEYRIPSFEPDSTASFRTTEPGGQRNADNNRTRTVTIPSTATTGYVVYNAFGDKSVLGAQGVDTTMSVVNPFIANWRGNFRLGGTDDDTSGRDESNNYNVLATQVAQSKAKVSWEYSIGGDGFAPHVEGAKNMSSSAPRYGFQVLRADSYPNLTVAQLQYTDVTSTVTGLSVYSDNDNDTWNTPVLFFDTSIAAATDSVFVYTVRTKNAYGMTNTETQQLTSGSGWDELTWAQLAVSVDGAIDGMYGLPLGTDPAGDQTAFSNLDLTKMWATRDNPFFYFALEVNSDIWAAPWGRYGIWIDTTGDTAGAPDFRHGSLGNSSKKVSFADRKPEYAIIISTTNESTGPPANLGELYRWNGGSWDNLGAVDALANSTSGGKSHIELSLARDRVGTPARIWIEGFASGNGADNPVLDAVNLLSGDTGNNELTAANFSVATVGAAALSTPFPPPILPPLAVTATAWDTRGYVSFIAPAMNINLIDHFNVYFGSTQATVASGSASALLGTVATGDTRYLIETTALTVGTRYYTRVFSVAADGESVGSSFAYCDVRGSYDTVVSIYMDSSGVTTVEIAKSARRDTSDAFFTVEILNYDEIWMMANFTDTTRMIELTKIHAANEKTFFSPYARSISTGTFPDTRSPVRQVTVRRPDGSRAPDTFFAEVSLRIPYLTSADSKTLIGPGLLNEQTLIIRKLNEGSSEWMAPNTEKTQWVMVDSDQVKITTAEFSIWTVLAGAGAITNLDRMVVYPNPFNVKDYFLAGHPSPAVVRFAFIPTTTEKIEIFSVAGDRVRTLDRTDGAEFRTDGTNIIATWDAKNDYGRDVASGIYVFWIRANGQVKIGKVAIIK